MWKCGVRTFCYLFYSSWIMFGLCFLQSCSEGRNKSTEELQAQIDSLQKENNLLTFQQEEVSEFLGIITESLDSITTKENIIKINGKGVEGTFRSKAELKKYLQEFSELLDRQRDKIAQLEDSLAKRGESFDRIKSIINYLNHQLDEKNRNIANLQKEIKKGKLQIKDLNDKVSEMVAANDSLINTISQREEALTIQDKTINTGYYFVGTKKELKEAGILSGGLLTKKLNASNFRNVKFEEIDITETTEFTIESKNISILTQMPKSSYTITNNGGQCILTITDPSEFWRVSNYLVIQMK